MLTQQCRHSETRNPVKRGKGSARADRRPCNHPLDRTPTTTPSGPISLLFISYRFTCLCMVVVTKSRIRRPLLPLSFTPCPLRKTQTVLTTAPTINTPLRCTHFYIRLKYAHLLLFEPSRFLVVDAAVILSNHPVLTPLLVHFMRHTPRSLSMLSVTLSFTEAMNDGETYMAQEKRCSRSKQDCWRIGGRTGPFMCVHLASHVHFRLIA
jgi:hypothetical protein